MEVENASVAPEGVSETPSVPMSLDAAASQMSQWPDSETTETQGNDAGQQPAVDDQGAAQVDAQPGAEGQQTQTDDQSIDWDKVPGNATFRLRDGTTLTAADLKRDFDDLRTARQMKQQYEAQSSELQQIHARVAQEAQMYAELAPRAIAAIQASIPEVPPYPSKELLNDPMAYQEAVDGYNRALLDRNAKIAEIQKIQQASAIQHQKAKVAEESQRQEFLRNEFSELTRKVPELRDQQKLKAFSDEVRDIGVNHYGFKPEELDIIDHRVMLVVRDALAYRKLQAAPPKPVQQTPQASPPASPGRRLSGGEAQAQQREQLTQKARQSGGLRDVAALIAQLD